MHTHRRATCLALAALVALTPRVPAQPDAPPTPANPVFVADSPVAAEALTRAAELLRAGNTEQAARIVQQRLDADPAALIASPAGEGLFVPLRSRLHALLQAEPALLAKYRELYTQPAAELLAAGRADEVERRFLLTPAGLVADLRLTQQHLDAGRFPSAVLTLAQLDAHPDRAASPAVAQLALTLARHTDDPRLAPLLERWAPGRPRPAPIATPISPDLPGEPASPLLPLVGADLPAGPLIPKPVVSARFGDEQPLDPARLSGSVSSIESVPPFARELRVIPAYQRHRLFATAGRSVCAFDDATLRLLWSVDPLVQIGQPDPADDPARVQRRRWMIGSADDVATIAPAGDLLVAVLGAEPTPGLPETPEHVVALDAASGAVRWARRFDTADAPLARTRIHGPPLTDGSIVVLSARKSPLERRFSAGYLVALDLYTGQHLWTALVGSAGSLPYARASQHSDGSLLHAGIIYRVDRVGVIAAYELATGRPRWVRALAPDAPADNSPAAPWDVSAPLVLDGSLFALTPDRTALLRLDPLSGEILARRAIPHDWSPSYLLSAGGRLVLVEDSRLHTLKPADVGTETNWASSPHLPDPGVRGRITVANQRLIVPLAGAIMVVDPARPDAPARVVELDHAGTPLVLADQLIVADDAYLHAYRSWDLADARLSELITSAPADPAPAILLAELAYRAAHPERLLPAIDAAERALASPLATDTLPQRLRLTDLLQRLIDQRQRPLASHPDAPVPEELVTPLIERLGRLATTPRQRAAHLLMFQADLRRRGQIPAAVEACQQILDEPDLASSTWDPRGSGVSAQDEATRRLELLLREHGPSIYTQQTAAAAAAVAALATNTEPATLEALARRYPMAPSVTSLWLRAARRYADAQLPRAQARALELGLAAAARLPGAPAKEVGELAGTLTDSLRQRGLLAAAADTLRQITQQYPDVPLTHDGRPLDRSALADTLARQFAALRRWPSLGAPAPSPKPQALVGWALLEPAIPNVHPVTLSMLPVQHEDGRFALFGVSDRDPSAPLTPRWSSPPGVKGWLLRVDHDSAWFFLQHERSSVIQKIDSTGAVAWTTKPFGEYFEPRVPPASSKHAEPPAPPHAAASVPTRPAINYISTPLEGYRQLAEQLIATDERTLAIVERTGRCAVLDADSALPLWASSLPITRVFDCDVIAGALVVAGEREQLAPGGAVSSTEHVILVLDARTGAVTREIIPPAGPVRRVTLTDHGDLIALLTTVVIAYDLETGQPIWKLTQQPAAGAVEMWPMDARLLLIAEDRSLWQIALSDGRVLAGPMDTRGRFDASSWRAARTAAGGACFMTSQGVVVFDRAGELVGVDALSPADNLLSAVAQPSLVLLASTPASRPGKDSDIYALHMLRPESAMLQRTVPLALGVKPERLMLLDQRIAVTAGHTTLIYPAPADR